MRTPITTINWESYNKECLVKIVQTQASVLDSQKNTNLAHTAVFCACCLKERCIPSNLIAASEDIIAYIYDSSNEPEWFERLGSVV